MNIRREKMNSKQAVLPIQIEDEMKRSYLDYAMSVIVGRALPDVRDGLKPVHRRILYAMNELGSTSDKPYKKSARIVGEVLGKYHPHGDVAVYDAIVRMAQDFSCRYPLIDGQGNFGSIDGDEAAAMRYTEIRLAKIAEEMLQDIEKNTVNFTPNFDGTLKEPAVLPSKVPNLLINGSSGIAVGMATSIPPHNLREVIDGLILSINKPQAEIGEIMQHIKGPDFPTGGIIYGTQGIVDAYATGKGAVKVRSKVSIEEGKDRKRIIVTELPFQVNKANLIESIASLARDRKVDGIVDLRDESNREGIRIVIELSKNASPDIVLNQLYKHTQMETTFGIINLALVEGQPVILTLKELLQHFIYHRREVVKRRTQFELENAEKRAHVLEGLSIALKNIDLAVKIIRGAATGEEARATLIKELALSEEQAKAVLEMKLQRLVALEQQKIDSEREELMRKISWLKEVLASEDKLLEIIKNELIELRDKYGDTRRTEILEKIEEISMEDLIPREQVIITKTHDNYIKRMPIDIYRMQRRGGRGVIGMQTKAEDLVEDLFIASTHDYILFFTNKGRAYWLKVYEIPSGDRYSRGKAIVNLINIQKDERITASIPIKSFSEACYLVMATKRGIVKKIPCRAFAKPRRTGIIAIGLKEGDELVEVKLTSGTEEIILSTKNGKAIRFRETDVRSMGRNAIGVRGIRLRGDDEVVSMEIVREKSTLLTITENGYGKRTSLEEYRCAHRGGQGVITIITSSRNGKVVAVKEVADGEELMLITSLGVIIRISANSIPVQGRNTQGVKIMNVAEGDRVVGVAKIAREEE
ncbi:MAG: DNA gyrase subunit A [Methanocellales archaeon]